MVDVDSDTCPTVIRALTEINVNFRAPCDGDKLLRTVVLIAKRELEDEELWLNYKLESDDTPEWYSPVSNSL